MKTDMKELMTVEGMVEAEIIKTKLESLGIPCYLKFESAGRLFGITMNGLGEVRVMVPSRFHARALKHMTRVGEKPVKSKK